MSVLPMFPLGTVLFPTMVLPLHVFEPRYRELMRRVLAGPSDPEFGVVLIERGSEVGGGDVRTDVGTVARLIEANQLPDGRWLVAAVGVRRIQVLDWLADDPFPIAQARDWPDSDEPGDLHEAVSAVVPKLRRALALRSELGEPGPPATFELVEDPVLASHQLGALLPCGPADKQRLLGCPGPVTRLALLGKLLDDAVALLEARLSG